MGKGLTPRYLQLLLRDYEIGSKAAACPTVASARASPAPVRDTWARYSPHILTTHVTPAAPEPQPATPTISPPALPRAAHRHRLPQRLNRAPSPPCTATTLPATAPDAPDTPAPTTQAAAPHSARRR